MSKQSRIVSTVMSLGLATALTASLAPPGHADVPVEDPVIQEIIAQDPDHIRYLGQPIRSSDPGVPVMGKLDGKDVIFQIYKGTANSSAPALFTAVDPRTGEILRQHQIPTASAALDLEVSPDGLVYIATNDDRSLWVYDPAADAMTNLGQFPRREGDPDVGPNAFGLCNGPAESIFIATYPEARIYQYVPGSAISEVADMSDEEQYIHQCAYDPDTDALYYALDGKNASVWRAEDAGKGERTRITNETNAPGLEAERMIPRMDFIGDHLVLRTRDLRLLVIDTTTDTVDHLSPARLTGGYHFVGGGPDPDLIYFAWDGKLQAYSISAKAVVETGLDMPGMMGDGTWTEDGLLVGHNGASPFVLDPATNTFTTHDVTIKQPITIQKMLHGPDGQVYASGFPRGLARVDTTGEGELYPTFNSGQYESSIVRDQKMYLGSYGNARLNVFDPATGEAPQGIFHGLAQGQDRPFGLVYNPERDEVYLGSVPGTGKTQGGFAVHEFSTGATTWFTDEIVKDQSIVSVLYNPNDKLVYIGTTVDGGLGSTPTGQIHGKLVVWDPATRTKVKELVAVSQREGVTGLTLGPDGKVWGIAEDNLFTYNPETGQIDLRRRVIGSRYVADKTYWAWAKMFVSPLDGRVYLTAGGRLLRIDPATMQHTPLMMKGAGYGTMDDTGDMYFSYSSHAMKYEVPVLVTNATAEQKRCQVVQGLREGREIEYAADLESRYRRTFEQLTEQVSAGRGERLASVYC